MIIDPHVHCRDGQQSHKETIAHVLNLCDQQGIDMIFDMPNTTPPLLRERDVAARLELVPPDMRRRYRMFLGVTANPEQIRIAADIATRNKFVVGLKLYAGRSVGELGVITEEEQKRVYQTLSAVGYKGVLAVHCEKEAWLKDVFDPALPITHSFCRPPEAEAQSIADQASFASAAGFAGTIHVCHLSSLAGLQAVRAGRKQAKMVCGVTPHHLLWSAAQAAGTGGLIYKVNPPLRSPADNLALRQALKDGEIDWIESDHAPHPISEKLFSPYFSGYPSLCLYRELVEKHLPAWGLDATRIKEVTSAAIQRVFDERKLEL